MKTNSKEVKELIKKHILESVSNNEGKYFTSLNELKEHVKNEFNRVANYPANLRQFPNNQDRFSDYLNGLPFNFLFYYSDINDFLNSLGINPENKEHSDEKSVKLYHYLIFREINK
jgi:5-formaminoimidazole-4-carboxamide-1-beta-D-ribofuranosyl 5'-monophosphate synthetase